MAQLWSFFGTVVLLILGYFGFRLFLDQRNRAFDRAQIAGFRERIRRDPSNVGAYEALGDACFLTKKYAEAAHAYQMAVNLGYQTRVVSEKTCYRLRLLQQWQAENANPALKPSLPVLCPSCGAVNHRSRQYCVECNMPLPTDTFFAAFAHSDVRRACVEGVAAVALVSVLVAAFSPLDAGGKIAVLAIVIGVALCWIGYTVDGSRA